MKRIIFLHWGLMMSSLLPACAYKPKLRAARPEGIIVPAYFYPEQENLPNWRQLDSAAASLGSRLVVVANPANGPGEAPDSNYVAVLTRLRRSGARIIGYVHTCWGDNSDESRQGSCWRPKSRVYKDIKRWYDWYEIDGIFFDEASGEASKVDYYQELYALVKRRQPQAVVVNNFGTVPDPVFSKVGDSVMCIFENHSDFAGWRHGQSWLEQGRANRLLALAYGVSQPNNLRTLLQHAAKQNIGWVYFTEQGGHNPWGKLPAFWQEMVTLIQR